MKNIKTTLLGIGVLAILFVACEKDTNTTSSGTSATSANTGTTSVLDTAFATVAAKTGPLKGKWEAVAKITETYYSRTAAKERKVDSLISVNKTTFSPQTYEFSDTSYVLTYPTIPSLNDVRTYKLIEGVIYRKSKTSGNYLPSLYMRYDTNNMKFYRAVRNATEYSTYVYNRID